MRPLETTAREPGFTLIELLIVVIILAILAAIVVPQFSSSTTDAQESALDANLTGMRSAIELFKAQHGAIYPGGVATTGGTCTAPGIAGTGAINTPQAFLEHLTMASDASGKTCSVGDATYKYGPYIRKGIPNEPINGRGSNVTVATEFALTSTGAPIVAGTAGGWAYDTKSGQFIMNSTANDSKSKAYSSH